MTIPYAEVIGDPIAHSKSPLIHGAWLKTLGLEFEYRRTRVRPDQLAGYLAERRADPLWRGCNVTIPHKIAVIEHLYRVESREVGAVNCVVPDAAGLRGLNSDVLGLVDALQACDAKGPIVLIGAGGAARAALAWMKLAGVPEIRVVAREPDKAEHLLGQFDCAGRVFPLESAVGAFAGAAGLLNATPMGMSGFDPMPEAVLAALDSLRPDAFVLDMVYAPVDTLLLRRAGTLGLTTVDGLAMLIGQARSAFRLFFGANPPQDGDAELRVLLTS